MYEARRALGPINTDTPPSREPPSPRRAAATWRDRLAQRTGMGLVALAATAATGAVALGGQPAPPLHLAAAPTVLDRDPAPLSRNADRSPGTLQLQPLSSSKLANVTRDLHAVTPLFTQAKLNIRAKPDEDAKLLGSIEAATKVAATSMIEGRYRQVAVGDLTGWVLAKRLDATPPAPAAPTTSGDSQASGITTKQCSRGTRVERKLRSDTIRIYRSVCALFPGVNSYGGWRAGGREFHKNGRALDIMLTPRKESALGWRIANYLIANSKAFNIDHIIFEQKIWTPRTPRWRGMADRGGTTANHYDHVHVAIRG